MQNETTGVALIVLKKGIAVYKKEDLIVLVHSPNNSTKIIALEEIEKDTNRGDKFKVDPEKGTWEREYEFQMTTRKIGESACFQANHKWGVICVYDRTNLDHIRRLASEAQEAVRDREAWYTSED